MVIHDAAGTRRSISITTAILRDREGEIVGGVETFRDLTMVRHSAQGDRAGVLLRRYHQPHSPHTHALRHPQSPQDRTIRRGELRRAARIGVTIAPEMTRTSDLRFRKPTTDRVGASLTATHCRLLYVPARRCVNRNYQRCRSSCYGLHLFAGIGQINLTSFISYRSEN